MSALGRAILAALCVIAVGVGPPAGPLHGQTAPATQPASRPLPETQPADLDKTALKYVPADCLGLYFIHNIRDFTDRVDRFVRRIAPESAEEGIRDFFKKITEDLKLGETFNPGGSLAVVMLDVRKYAPGLAKSVKPAEGEARPDLDTFNLKDLPVAIIVPGSDAMKMFADHRPSRDGKLVRLDGDGTEDPWFCLDLPGYVVLSPRKQVLEVFPPPKSILERLSPTERAAVARSQAGGWADFTALREIRDSVLVAKVKESLSEMSEFGMGMPVAYIAKYVEATRGLSLGQAEARVFGVRVVEEGLLFEVRGRYPPDSAVGKALLAAKPAPGSLLTALPDMPFIVAAHGTKDMKVPAELREKHIQALLARPTFQKMPEEVRTTIRDLMLSVGQQVRAAQWYFGGVTTKQGMFAAACIVECESPEEFRKVLRKGAEFTPKFFEAVIKATGGDVDESMKFEVKFVEAAETIGSVKADAFLIEHPSLAGMDPEDRNRFRGIFGEDKLRLLVFQTGPNTLACTFGGGTSFAEEVLKSAGGKGGLPAQAGVKKALSMLPENRVAVGMFSIANAFGLATNLETFMEPDIPARRKTLNAPVPFALSLSVEKNELYLTVFVPAETIQAFTHMMDD